MTTTPQPVVRREPILCDCCGQETLAYRVVVNGEERLFVKARRHGRDHMVVIAIDEGRTLSN